MSYCMRCGRQTDNEDFICDDCRRKDGASPDAGQGAAAPGQDAGTPFARPQSAGGAVQTPQGNGQNWQPRATMEQPYRNSPYGSVPNTPWAAANGAYGFQPAATGPADRSGFPLNKCGLIGMIFSLAGLVCWIGIFILVVAFVASNPEAFNNPYYQPPDSEVMMLGIGAFFLLIGAFGFSVTGIVLSGVGLARYKRFRAVGFAIAGLAVGIIILLITMSFFGTVFS